MEFKGTKGEWIAENRGNKYMLYIHNENGLRVCEVKSFDTSDVYTDPTTKEADANAKLIAAAPELLKALQSMVGLFDRNLPAESMGSIKCLKAREVINKALN